MIGGAVVELAICMYVVVIFNQPIGATDYTSNCLAMFFLQHIDICYICICTCMLAVMVEELKSG